MPEPQRRRLTRLKFDRVDLVDMGANFDVATGDGAHILLAKALHADDDKKKKPKNKLPAFLRGKRTDLDDAGELCALLPAIIAVVETTIDALRKATPIAKDDHALTFEDALFARKMGEVQHELGIRFGALMESVDSVMFSEEKNKKKAVAERVGQFVASVKSAIPDLLKDLEKREPVEEILAGLLTLEDVDTGETPMAFKKTDLTGEALAAYEALETSVATLTKSVVDLKKAAKPADPGDGEPTEAQQLEKVGDPVVRALLVKSFADTRKANARAVKAEQTADVEKQARLIRGEVDLLKGFRNLTFKPTDDAPHVLVLKAAGDGKAWTRMLEVLKAADALLAKRPIFNEVGQTGAGDGGPDTAVGRAQAKAAELIAKDDKLDVGKALEKVFREDPGLYEAYKGETELRVGSTDDDEGGAGDE